MNTNKFMFLFATLLFVCGCASKDKTISEEEQMKTNQNKQQYKQDMDSRMEN